MKADTLSDLMGVFRTTTRERWDWISPLAIVGLSAIGVCFIYSAQFSSLPVNTPHESIFALVARSYWMKQLLFLLVGTGIYWGVSLVDYRHWLSLAHPLYAVCVIPLGLVLVPLFGHSTYGSSRWLSLGPLRFQPSEPAKIAVLLITASILIRSKVGTIRQSMGVLGKLTLAVGVPILLIVLQPDLKSAIVLPPMVFSMLYVSKLSGRFFATALGVFLIVVGLVSWDTYRYYNFMASLPRPADGRIDFQGHRGEFQRHSFLPFLHDYQRERILAFVDPAKIDAQGIGYNQHQSLISVGSGGLFGKGWTAGTQARLGYLPHTVAHNDFIFSVIAEEKGFLGSLSVLVLFGIVLFNGIRIAGLARDRLGTLLAIGVTVLLTVHVFVNIAMTIGLVPVTGIPLPFISYGGSFVLSCCFLQGLVQSVYRFRKDLL
ncbi:MAG TPA: FtsW/RodA/SpoVE family cell cycle protein [Opitutaceae bacterium]|jgi:rod shape determining protein RodA|nr:FtsW/RodA/SpoVE family cell cycle protein [Opitutaceae bacterium]